MHPAARLQATKSRFLSGRRIVLGVTGSIAAVETVRIAHELIRHGADVIPVMTASAQTFITPLALEYATGRAPITSLTGRGEHVALMDGKERADLLLIAPATANTISKIALGIDDSPVTTFATVALGSGVPILIAPAMHEVMGKNPAIAQRLKDLHRHGVRFVEPRMEEEKAKLATPEEIAEACIHTLAEGPWKGKEVLVISGATAEPVDPVRVLTNRSSGRMGVELAVAAHRSGTQVTLWNAWGLVPLPSFLSVRRYETVDDLLALVEKEDLARFDAVFMPAALSDFAPESASKKISSETSQVTVTLRRLPKVIKSVRRKARRAVLVAFKAESEAKQLAARARTRLTEYKADLVVANTSEAFGAQRSEVLLVTPKGVPRRLKGTKAEVAQGILAAAAPLLSR